MLPKCADLFLNNLQQCVLSIKPIKELLAALYDFFNTTSYVVDTDLLCYSVLVLTLPCIYTLILEAIYVCTKNKLISPQLFCANATFALL